MKVEDFALGGMEPETLVQLARKGILNHTEMDKNGTYVRSVAVALIEAPLAQTVAAVEQIREKNGGFLREINMINKFRIIDQADDRLRVRIDLRYRYFVFSFRFHVIADVVTGEEGCLDLKGVGGKIKKLSTAPQK